MPEFKPGVSVTTKKPVVVVNAGLKPGMHRFQLVIKNNKGEESHPSIHSIRVLVPPVEEPKKDEGKVPKPKPSKPKKDADTAPKPKPAKPVKAGGKGNKPKKE
jgi:hypothetical protein